MEEDAEVLDWGNEDDEAQVMELHRVALQPSGQDDAEDAVSLGGDEDDEIYPYRAASQEDLWKGQYTAADTAQILQQTPSLKGDLQRENPGTAQKPSSKQSDLSQLCRSQSLGQLTHALPPKPPVAPPPFVPTTSVQTSTIASAMVVRDRRSNGHSKNVPGSRDRGTGLPPDWEERFPRNGSSDPYYYNIKTHESTWKRPMQGHSEPLSPAKEREVDVRVSVDPLPRRGGAHAISGSPRRGDGPRASPDGPLSFKDRHYRPDALSTVNGTDTMRDQPKLTPAGPDLPLRPLSPHVAERRRDVHPSSLPLRRQDQSLKRSSRIPRDVLSPSANQGATVRYNADARPNSVQDTAWTQSRTAGPQEDTYVRDFSHDDAIPRGHRPRDDSPPERIRNNQGTRDAYHSRSAPSTLSASYLLAIHRIPACVFLSRQRIL
jgi:hypothetical protein